MTLLTCSDNGCGCKPLIPSATSSFFGQLRAWTLLIKVCTTDVNPRKAMDKVTASPTKLNVDTGKMGYSQYFTNMLVTATEAKQFPNACTTSDYKVKTIQHPAFCHPFTTPISAAPALVT